MVDMKSLSRDVIHPAKQFRTIEIVLVRDNMAAHGQHS
jgi:hypothetical protein